MDSTVWRDLEYGGRSREEQVDDVLQRARRMHDSATVRGLVAYKCAQ